MIFLSPNVYYRRRNPFVNRGSRCERQKKTNKEKKDKNCLLYNGIYMQVELSRLAFYAKDFLEHTFLGV